MNVSTTEPIITIGMPVHNGERHLRDALDSLLAQTMSNFRLVISDNASTDATPNICREYMARDDRISYRRFAENQGASTNFNSLLEGIHTKYFMWASDHDLWHEDFIRLCVNELESSSECVLVYPQTRFIDHRGTPVMDWADEYSLDSDSPLARYRTLIWNLTWCNMVYGVFRREALLRTSGFQRIWAPDHLMLAEIVLLGKVHQLTERAFLRRNQREPETVEQGKQRVLHDLDPGSAATRNRIRVDLLNKELRRAHLQLVRGTSMLKRREKLVAWIDTLLAFRRLGVQLPLERALAPVARRVLPRNLKTSISKGWQRS